jgi:hypothetical protein
VLEVPAELCVVRRGCSARLHRGAQRLPSFLHRLEETLVAEKLRRKIGSKVHASKVRGGLFAVGSDLISTRSILQCGAQLPSFMCSGEDVLVGETIRQKISSSVH